MDVQDKNRKSAEDDSHPSFSRCRTGRVNSSVFKATQTWCRSRLLTCEVRQELLLGKNQNETSNGQVLTERWDRCAWWRLARIATCIVFQMGRWGQRKKSHRDSISVARFRFKSHPRPAGTQCWSSDWFDLRRAKQQLTMRMQRYKKRRAFGIFRDKSWTSGFQLDG